MDKSKINIALSGEQFRHLLDLVYVGNWVLNSMRGEDRIDEYDSLESHIFSYCEKTGLRGLIERGPDIIPSRRYEEGGIHEAIMDYEDVVFFEILAEELARRDMRDKDADGEDFEELQQKIDEYMEEFSQNGIDNILIEGYEPEE